MCYKVSDHILLFACHLLSLFDINSKPSTSLLNIFISNPSGFIEYSIQTSLPLESGSLTNISSSFHMYCYNYSTSNSIFQPNKSIVLFLPLLQITSKYYYKLLQKTF